MLELAAPIASELRAVLGPTNTGKTHRAIQRLLDFETGMIGLPLRLLAREVYDRVTQLVGEQRVALITGEEKRIPKSPSYFICTVEAMPTNLEVVFVAIDEVQLIAHATRGHVFTQRLLEARGIRETWFLGSDTAAPLLRALVPAAKHQSYPRLSRLQCTGSHTLGRLPKRSAVVAFSIPQVYELAERIRARRGGVAVVLGALSPRTRNAQVAMYQAGEVDYLVATDAIGMGLNLLVDHVAFASLRKFDGKGHRELFARELAQIAGRAGRYLSDGSFGVLAPLPPLSESVARAIECHKFEQHRMACWRNSELDFSALDAVLGSLVAPPPHPALRLQNDAEDAAAFRYLAAFSWVQQSCRTPDAIRLLWDVCQIPDYRKLLPELHANLLGEIFAELLQGDGKLSNAWMERRVNALDDTSGDLDALMGRIAFIRTWTYVAQHAAWVESKKEWQERTRAVEDRLSDALHEGLVQRFVEKTRAHTSPSLLTLRKREAKAKAKQGHARGDRNQPLFERSDSPFEKLLELKLKLTGEAPPSAGFDALSAAVDARHEQLILEPDGRITYQHQDLGKLTAGKSLLQPQVSLAKTTLGAGAEASLRRRLQAFTRDLLSELKGRWYVDDHPEPAVRGILYQLLEQLGTMPKEHARVQLKALSASDLNWLKQRGVQIGQRLIWVPALLKPRALIQRRALLEAHHGKLSFPAITSGAVSLPQVPASAKERRERTLQAGYLSLGPRLVRCDMVERLLSELKQGHSVSIPTDGARLCGLIGCKKSELSKVLLALNVKLDRNRSQPIVDARSKQRRGSG